MMSLKYDNFRFYWAVVTEKHLNVSMQSYHTFAFEFYSINWLFLWSQIS